MPLDWKKLADAQPAAATEPTVSQTDGTKKLSKKKDPAFTMSSFYVQRKVNIAFDRALLGLRERGLTLERSEVLEKLMEAFADKIEDQLDGLSGEADARTFNAAIGRVMYSVELSVENDSGETVTVQNPHRSGG